MCKLNAALTHAQILYALLLSKRLIPPKRRSLQSFLKLKKSVFHMPISFSLFLFIYIDLDSAYQPCCIESGFYFSLNKLDVILFVTLCMWYKKMEEPQLQLLHFCDSKHPLVYRPEYRGGATCCGCQESIYGPSYYCPRGGCPSYYWHHKSCAELPLGLHHPLHPLHPLILFDEKTDYLEKENSNCQIYKESCFEYTYRCYCYDFNLHTKCAVLQLEVEFHDHPHQVMLSYVKIYSWYSNDVNLH